MRRPRLARLVLRTVAYCAVCCVTLIVNHLSAQLTAHLLLVLVLSFLSIYWCYPLLCNLLFLGKWE
ncbi:hypothetical protein F5Y15DRAFT_379590 [Xylariaceae sp. FL0016]|nr:hypothetical protein F5Y15DRAFT_379590 [Xylariaceae sp. FL0016]